MGTHTATKTSSPEWKFQQRAHGKMVDRVGWYYLGVSNLSTMGSEGGKRVLDGCDYDFE